MEKSKLKMFVIIIIILVIAIIEIIIVNNSKSKNYNVNSKEFEFYSDNTNLPTIDSVIKDVTMVKSVTEIDDYSMYMYKLNDSDVNEVIETLEKYVSVVSKYNNDNYYIEEAPDTNDLSGYTFDIRKDGTSDVIATINCSYIIDEQCYTLTMCLWKNKIK